MTKRGQKIAHCHKDLAKVAKELCAASYDELMSNNALYDAWKKANPQFVRGPSVDAVRLKRAFVTRKWGLYVEAARATLALLLREPIDDLQKEHIMRVLTLDASLIRGRVRPAMLAGTAQLKN